MEDTIEKKPFRTVYTIIDKGPGKKSFFMKIGIARLNHDQSWNVYLDAMPFDRKLHIRDADDRPRYDANAERTTPAQPSFDIGGIQ